MDSDKINSKYSLVQMPWWTNPYITFLEEKSYTAAPLRQQAMFTSVQLFSHVRLFATPWIAAWQASLSTTNSQSLLKLMSIESVMPSSHLILCFPFSSCPQSLQASGSFPMSQLFAWGGQSTGVSASASVLPVNTQDWSPLQWTSWISLQSKCSLHTTVNLTRPSFFDFFFF